MSPSPDATDPPSGERPQRRARYKGKNPRRFAEKYKEHDPTRYADEVAKVIAAGKTPAGAHLPIMVSEILAALAPKPGAVVVDCTLGFGGHARAILPALAPGGLLLGLDADPIELPKTEARLRAEGYGEESFRAIRSNFAGLPKALAGLGVGGADAILADAILADLGVSSMQLDDPVRGFTFKSDGPLDLRLNPARPPSGAEWLARASQEDLERALRDNSDEPHAELLARELLARQRARPFTRTLELATAVREVVRGANLGSDPEIAERSVRRVFQALRIEVNDEFGVLELLLRFLPGCLKPGGRAAILTFHSGEDRRVKRAFREGVSAGIYSATNEAVIRAGREERRANPRSTSAKLRWAVRAG